MEFDDYIPAGHTPNSTSIKQAYLSASKELLKPFPSTKFITFQKLNQMTGGLRPYEFSIFCGSTGTGKTCCMANLSGDLLVQDIPHFVASVETGGTDFVKRVISSVSQRDWNSGDAVPIDSLKEFHIKHGARFNTENVHISLYEDRFSVEALMADIAYHVKHHGIKVAIIDNLNFFLEVTAAEQTIVEMDRVIHNLIIFCKKVPVHIIMVMHPKKTENGRVESEFDVKGSSTAVQEAHNVFLFNRPHPDLIRGEYARLQDRELKLAKMRRRGKFVGRRLILRCDDSVSYHEGDII